METDPPDPAVETAGAHMSSHKSARIAPMELITRNERRRRWTVEQKQMIAAQSLVAGASATDVARQHGIGTGQLYNWRKALLAAQPAAVAGRFARVEVATAGPMLRGAGHHERCLDVGGQTGPTRQLDRDCLADRHDAACGRASRPACLASHFGGAAWMIALPSGGRVWLACGHTDMRKGMDRLAMLAQQMLTEDPFSGALSAFRGKRGGLVKLLWFDGQGMCLFSKRLERGHFVWPVSPTGRVSLSAAQLSMLLEGIDWRMPQRVRRPELAG
jgi:transposase